MRIVLLAVTLHRGGAERQLRVLAGALAGRGHRVTVVTYFPEGDHREALARDGRVELRTLHPRRARGKVGVLLQLLRAPSRLRAVIRDVGPDVVYSWLEIANLGAGRALGGEGDPPVVWGGRNTGGRESLPVRMARRLGARRSPRIPLMICNSEAGRLAHEALGFRPARMAVVPNGIDTELFRPDRAAGAELRRAWLEGATGPLVGVVGRLDPMKDHGTFLAAAADLATTLPEARFVLVGGGPRDAALRDEAADRGVADRVVFAGEMEGMVAVHNALDLLVLSSAWGEGFSNVLGEALACGVPSVVTDVGDAASIVGDPERVVPAGDAGALAKAMAAALEAPGPPREDLRRRVVEAFGVEAMVDATEKLLREAAGRGVG